MTNSVRMMAMAVMLMVLPGCSGCSEEIQPGTTGVVVSWGSLQPWTYGEGFHWIDPFYDIYVLSLRTQNYDMGGAAARNADGSAGVQPEAAIEILTQDQLAVSLQVSVQFHLERSAAPEVYRLFGANYETSTVHPIVRSSIRDAASTFTAIALVDERDRLQTSMETRVEERLRSTLVARGLPENAIVIENILLRDIDLPASLEASIAAVQQQHQETARATEALETSRMEANRTVVAAEAAARVRTIEAESIASANRALSASITPETLELRRIEAMQALLSNPQTRTVFVPNTGMTLMLGNQ